MRARFKGWCRAGKHPVKPGEIIQHVPGGWAHPSCGWVKAGTKGWPEPKEGGSLADTEVAQGYALAQHLSETARYFGEEAAAAEEYAWSQKLGDY